MFLFNKVFLYVNSKLMQMTTPKWLNIDLKYEFIWEKKMKLIHSHFFEISSPLKKEK